MAKSLFIKENKNIREPIYGANWHDLFEFFWSHGIGNTLSKHDVPISWTSISLEYEFNGMGYSISERTIDDWKSGKRLPSVTNTHKLARIISKDDERFFKKWDNELIAARYREEIFRKNRKLERQSKPEPIEKSESQTHSIALEKESATVRRGYSLKALLFLCSFSSLISCLALYSLLAFTQRLETHTQSVAKDIKFCTKKQFDNFNKICLLNMTEFLPSVEMIYVSFKLEGAYKGQKFERTWIRNGEKFLTKESYYDESWSGFTYILNPNGHDPGKYVLRIMVDEISSTGYFTVGN